MMLKVLVLKAQGRHVMCSCLAFFRGTFWSKKREGAPEMGTKPLKTLRGHRASNRGSKSLQSRLSGALIEALGASNRGSKTLEKHPGL